MLREAVAEVRAGAGCRAGRGPRRLSDLAATDQRAAQPLARRLSRRKAHHRRRRPRRGLVPVGQFVQRASGVVNAPVVWLT